MAATASDIALALRLADAAGAAIRPWFRRLGEAADSVETKEDASPVTVADRAAEAAMRRLLDAEAAGDGVIGEEFGDKPGVTGRQWVLDPIDGTRSFTAGRAIFVR
jgi:fructose-1,6-bisphosphatase/inositol monophosphatase family enzyme